MNSSDAESGAARRQFYDSTAGLYRATFHIIWRVGFPGLRRRLRLELQGLPVVLDAGAATGYWSKVIAGDTSKRVVAMDFSGPYVTMAKRYLRGVPGVGLVQADIHATPFGDASFDAVLCSGVLDTMPHPSMALAELRRVLHPHGKLILVIRARDSGTSSATERLIRAALSSFRTVTGRAKQSGIDSQVWQRTPVWPRLAELAAENGLAITSVHHGRLATDVVLEAI